MWCDLTDRKHTVSDEASEEYVRYLTKEAKVGATGKLYSFKTCESCVLSLRDFREQLIAEGALKHDEV